MPFLLATVHSLQADDGRTNNNYGKSVTSLLRIAVTLKISLFFLKF